MPLRPRFSTTRPYSSCNGNAVLRYDVHPGWAAPLPARLRGLSPCHFHHPAGSPPRRTAPAVRWHSFPAHAVMRPSCRIIQSLADCCPRFSAVVTATIRIFPVNKASPATPRTFLYRSVFRALIPARPVVRPPRQTALLHTPRCRGRL